MQRTATHGFPTVMLILSEIILMLTVATGAGADVLLDNFGALSGTTYDDIQGYASQGKWQHEASGGVSFTPTGSDYALNTISVIAKYFSGTSTSFELSLYSNDTNDTRSPIPGTRIASRTITLNASSANYSVYTADFGSDILLARDTVYWAVVEASSPTSDVYFGVLKGVLPALPSARRAMFSNMQLRLNADGTTNTTVKDPYWMHMYNDSLQVTATAVPEPSGLLALVGGITSLVGFAGLQRRRANR